METIITFNFSHAAILGFMYQLNRGFSILGAITSCCSGSKPALLPWRAFLKRPENFSGPETVPQSSRNDFRVFLKAPEKF